jgi:hypothetical protein
LAIRVIQENHLAPVAAIHDVIHRTGIFDSPLAGHAGRVRVPCAASCINIKN